MGCEPLDGVLLALPVEDVSSGPVSGAQRILDHFGVRSRLEEVLRYLWRGGSVSLTVDPAAGLPHVRYTAKAAWDAAVFVRAASPVTPDLARRTDPVAEGAWRRGRAGYWLAVGIDAAAAPTAIYVRSEGLSYLVPFLDRPDEEVARALERALAEYGKQFVERQRPVTEAMAAEADRLRQLGL